MALVVKPKPSKLSARQCVWGGPLEFRHLVEAAHDVTPRVRNGLSMGIAADAGHLAGRNLAPTAACVAKFTARRFPEK